jgi:hypothetical protein
VPVRSAYAPDVATVAKADVSTLSVFKLVKFASTSTWVNGDPLAARVTMVAMSYPLIKCDV